MGETLEETLEPLGNDASGTQVENHDEAVLVVLHHADLNKVGAVSALASANDATLIGRDTPLFTRHSSVGPLQDPCISRRLCTVRYDEGRGQFEVEVQEARRPARLLTSVGAPLDGRWAPPGSLLALGDRVLLGLVVRPRRQQPGDQGLVGESASMEALRARVRAVAAGDETVLILGETGTGKELVARAIHQQSPRRGGPLLAVNCAALPEALAESELFGHVKGAFSGATGSDGLFGAARGGTLFLDEVGELPLPVQAKLLRALELRRIRPVGSTHESPLDVRVVAATHRDLEQSCRQGVFREDLLARLETLRLSVAPLRERRLDIPLLFAHFLGERLAVEAPRHRGCAALRDRLFRPAAIESPPLPQEFFLSLLGHGWPHNAREVLGKAIEVVVTARDKGALVLPALPTPEPSLVAPPSSRPDRAELLRLLDEHNGAQSHVARRLNISTTTMDRWMRELGIARPRDLSAEDIEAALLQHGGHLERAASDLGVSPRGLRLRLRQLDQGPPERSRKLPLAGRSFQERAPAAWPTRGEPFSLLSSARGGGAPAAMGGRP